MKISTREVKNKKKHQLLNLTLKIKKRLSDFKSKNMGNNLIQRVLKKIIGKAIKRIQ